MNKRTATHLSLIVLLTLLLGFFDLPYEQQTGILPSTPERLENQHVNLGLDLQGGSQLDYKIDLRRVNESDREQIIEGVLEVINRRVNGLGVAEPNIYRSSVAEEEHIVVELAGIKDLEEAKGTVGKTIQLEFKEENDQERSPEEISNIKSMAQAALERILGGEELTLVAGQEEETNQSMVHYFKAETDEDYVLEEDLAEGYLEAINAMEVGSVWPELIQTNDGYTFDSEGNFVPLEGFFIIQFLDKREGERVIHEDKEIQTRHILIAYQGAERAEESVTRSKEEALALAEEVKQKAINGENFATLAGDYSDEPGAADRGGDLGFFGPGEMSKPFEDAAFALEKDQISEVVETEFGYHVIQVTDIKPEVNETTPEMEYKINRLLYSTARDAWKATALTGEQFVRADVVFSQSYTPYVSIEFTEEGKTLFAELTERNINKRIAIFVGGELISAPNVNEKIDQGRAQITGTFSVEEASTLARDLNTGAIPAPIILVGQYTIGASLGEEALESSIKGALIGLVILAIFMLAYYRYLGLIANLALILYALALLFFIKVSMPLGWALGISTIAFGLIVSSILKNRDSGWEKMISFLLACFVLFFLTYMLSTPIVLTLAGVAGVVLSIGMAVDANILIFERIREELRDGRPFKDAIEIGFDRAWSSIRDSNFSSLITTAILMYFGTSIIKGFAVNLALGILISMFTAITITRSLLRAGADQKWIQNCHLIGVPKKGHRDLPIIQKRKIWFGLSGTLVIASLLVFTTQGLKLGMDFTGGTFMEIKFEIPVESDAIKESLTTLEADLLKTQNPSEDENPSTDETGLNVLEEDKEISIDFGDPVIVASGENQMIIRIKHISNETHEAILTRLSETFGPLEETRYNTVGATIGQSMKEKAVIALGIASIMIVVYIAFAFRRVPKEVSPWRFGIAAIAALIHDLIITLGAFVILGMTLGVEIDTLFITALLTIMGFSVHDTIVVFDRIRENLKNQKRNEPFEIVANRAVNETLARSINTSLSTLFTVVALFLFGAISIHYFLFALIVGFITGTYSSIFIATPLLVEWHNRKNR